ncbi:uncharacterized protein LOC122304883 [Carya illinoinensis]|uniref:uncharacterized protein LOC122304883 n=1 Tax=Carya illinoinensis TaxID=32201 RepID=UPI001C722FA5|nr:uncharacterized protein LOC122304883 [Carya illinoinensis]
MAEGTRSREALQRQVDSLEESSKTVNERLDQLTDMVRTLIANHNNIVNREVPLGHEGGEPNRGGFNRTVRLEFPHFNGDNPTGWIFKANQYFEIHQTNPAQRLLIASYHMEEEALVWYQDAYESGQLTSWDTFVRALLLRFGPTAYNDPMEGLTRLKQTTTVSAYKAEFESLSNRLRGLSAPYKLSVFLSGLKDEIHLPVKMLNPINLGAAFGLAKVQEEYLLTSKKPFTRPHSDRSMSSWGTNPNPTGQYSEGSSSSKGGRYVSPNRKLFSTSMDEKRCKGLCYHCEEKWNPTHQCKAPKAYLLQTLEEPLEAGQTELAENEDNDPEMEPLVEQPESGISLNAMSGNPNAQTMRLLGNLCGVQVVVLIDSGSTNNFMDPWVSRKTKLLVADPRPISIKIANGDVIQGEGQCSEVPLKLQGTHITTFFYLLKLGGCDLVLGVAWLQTLGPILWDFAKLTMEFGGRDGKQVLKGLKPGESTVEGSSKSLLHSINRGQGFWLQWQEAQTMEKNLSSEFQRTHLDIKALLTQFKKIFDTPQDLPPTRSKDHRIILKAGTQAISTRPYHYPHYQKNEIEKLVTEMLQTGVIRPSSSPFSSPVLLV